MATFFEYLLDYTFYYPLFMSFLWMIGATYYFLYRERNEKYKHYESPELDEYPGVTYVVPCHNEGIMFARPLNLYWTRIIQAPKSLRSTTPAMTTLVTYSNH